MTFGDFLKELNTLVSPTTRSVVALTAKTDSHSLNRFVSKPNARPSQNLTNYLGTQCEHVTTDLNAEQGNPKKFFNGFNQGWYPIQAAIDVSRSLTRTILEEQVAVIDSLNLPSLVLVKGPAGSGKSLILRRLAWESGRNLGKLTLYVAQGGLISVRALEGNIRYNQRAGDSGR